MTAKTAQDHWQEVGYRVMNCVKVYLLKHYVEDILYYYSTRIDYLVKRYARYLPSYVAQSETDDLKTIARLEFVETLKAWDVNKSDAIWPLAQVRIVGAMKDHIRYITRTDPTRFYDWIADSAHVYLAIHDRADFQHSIETGVQLGEAMQVLTDREKGILISHTKDDCTFKQIGDALGISESQISRIYKKSVEKIRKVMEKG